jgi:hypothetical protein
VGLKIGTDKIHNMNHKHEQPHPVISLDSQIPTFYGKFCFNIIISTTFEIKTVLTFQKQEGSPATNVFKPWSVYELLDEV